MNNHEVIRSKLLKTSLPLWQYMSLEKLIYLLSKKQLYFTPLSVFKDSDPFEGCKPEVLIKEHVKAYKAEIMELEKATQSVLGEDINNPLYSDLITKIQKVKRTPALVHDAIIDRTVVNCWHASETESEAMWKLYTDNGKGIAIESTVGNLEKSINSLKQKYKVQLYPVKYLDFSKKDLKASECVMDGHTSPVLKRVAFEHEKEIRAFILPNPDGNHLSDLLQVPTSSIEIPVNLDLLISKIHISPFSKEPFIESVFTVCELLGINKTKVCKSQLLSHEARVDLVQLLEINTVGT